jgi:hypothetical protein
VAFYSVSSSKDFIIYSVSPRQDFQLLMDIYSVPLSRVFRFWWPSTQCHPAKASSSIRCLSVDFQLLVAFYSVSSSKGFIIYSVSPRQDFQLLMDIYSVPLGRVFIIYSVLSRKDFIIYSVPLGRLSSYGWPFIQFYPAKISSSIH